MADLILGIDLGTSTTEAAVIRDGKPEMILNFDGKEITPSAVGVDENQCYIFGEKAKSRHLLYPENTVIEAKRKIGTGERLTLGRRKYTACEISALLLGHVKEYAEEYLGEEISRAVISVPAYFDDLQRQETVKAGEDAGFTVERIINEPTASALSYGIDHMDEESYILVYDLGGGTFDVTLLELFEGIVEVKASSGDNRLGGKDFDEALVAELLARFRKKYGVDLANDRAAMVQLKEQAESCKKELSTRDSVRISIPFLAEKNGQPLGMDEIVTAAEFEALTRELLIRTHKPLNVVLADGGVTADEIDMVLLVGGSTRMPMVGRDVKAYLGIEPCQAVNPDFAVAEGAAVLAGMLSGQISRRDGIVMTDVNPYTLGVRTVTDYEKYCMSVVIPRNVTIPVKRSRIFYTAGNRQTSAEIEIYQGEAPDVRENHFLGKFMISGIPPAAAGKEAVEVEFSYNVNGMLDVRAVVVSTGSAASVNIDMMEQKEEAVSEDLTKWKEAPHARRYRAVIRRAERLLEKGDFADTDSSREELKDSLNELKRAVIANDTDWAARLEDELLDMLEEEE